MSNQTQININGVKYSEILHQTTRQINSPQTLIAKQVNSIANSVYWNFGKQLFEKKLEEGYSGGDVKRLSIGYKNKFRDRDLSPCKLRNMKYFYKLYYQVDTKLLQVMAVLLWGRNLLSDKVQSLSAFAFYGNEVGTRSWLRNLLINAIKMDSYSLANNQLKIKNLSNTLPEINAEYANEVFKRSYYIGFLGIAELV